MMEQENITRIEKIISSGYGLGRIGSKVYFIHQAIPDETVEFRVQEEKKNYSICSIERIVVESENRVTPACQYFGKCGGCDFQHMNYQTQSESKKNILCELLQKNAAYRTEPDSIEFIPSMKFNYRNKLTLHSNGSVLGMYMQKSHDIIPVESCSIASEKLNKILQSIGNIASFTKTVVIRESSQGITTTVIHLTREISQTEKLELNLKSDNIIIVHNGKTTVHKGNEKIADMAGNFILYYSYRNFMQVNKGIADEIGKFLHSKIPNTSNLLELYSGTGFFTCMLSGRFRNILSIESSRNAVHFQNLNLRSNKIKNVKTVCSFINDNTRIDEHNFDVILADPPREGIPPVFLKRIIDKSRDSFIYVSCDPGTLTRDTAIILRAGFSISDIKIFDMFPQTRHFETVMIFRRT